MSMKRCAILHIGTGKAGSTTIQKGLRSHAEALRKMSIGVPNFGGRLLNHLDVYNLVSGNGPHHEAQGLRHEFSSWLAASGCSQVVLSSEFLWYDTHAPDNTRNYLLENFEEVKVIAFLREPVSYYRSTIQQMLKAGGEVKNPKTWHANYKDRVERWSEAFGEAFRVVPFQKSTIGADIFSFFLSHVMNLESHLLPMATISPKSMGAENASEFAEVSFIMQKYFRICHAGEPRAFRPEAQRLRSILQKTAIEIGEGSRPKLKEAVSAMVLQNHIHDLIWLRDVMNITFEGVDYGRLDDTSSVFEPLKGGNEVRDLMEINEVSAEHILFTSIKALASLK